ncbi:MAG TPA: hypothetical protein VHL58_02890 [Thermoanaerobaculia bacterium]|nr:hypothetical protein [Thermoanaerobaculia bacterium]
MPSPLLFALLSVLFFVRAVAGELPISTRDVVPAIGMQTNLHIASNGKTFLGVWQDWQILGPRSDSDIMAARFDEDGKVLDSTPIRIAESDVAEINPAVFWTGHNFVVVWQTVDSSAILFFRRIDSDGHFIDDAPLRAAISPSRNVYRMSMSGSDLVAIPSEDGDVLVFSPELELRRSFPIGRSDVSTVTSSGIVTVRAGGTTAVVQTISLEGTTLSTQTMPFSRYGVQRLACSELACVAVGSVYGSRISSAHSQTYVFERASGRGRSILDTDESDGGDVIWTGTLFVRVWNSGGAMRESRLDAAGEPFREIFHTSPFPPSQSLYQPRLFFENGTAYITGMQGENVAVTRDEPGAPAFPVALGPSMQLAPAAAPGPRGESLVAWIRVWDSGSEVRAARLAASGSPLDSEGTRIVTGANAIAVASDGESYLIAWSTGFNGFAVRVSGNGEVLDTVPIALGTHPSRRYRPRGMAFTISSRGRAPSSMLHELIGKDDSSTRYLCLFPLPIPPPLGSQSVLAGINFSSPGGRTRLPASRRATPRRARVSSLPASIAME